MMSIEILLILLAAGLVAGYIDAIVGGGGMIALPTLLAVGIPPHAALGSNKLAGTMGVMNAARIFIKQGILKPKLWQCAIIATFIGAAVGVIVVHFFTADFLENLIPLLITVLAIYLLIAKPLSKQYSIKNHFKPPSKSSSVMGSVLGFYDGFFGPGTGAFWVTLLVRYYQLDLLNAVAATKILNFTSNIAALSAFIILGHIDYISGLALGSAYITGSHLGTHAAIKHGAKLIRPIFLITVITLAVYLIV